MVAVSGYAEASDIDPAEEARQLGVRLIVKGSDFTPDDLLNMLRDLIGAR